MKICPSLAEVGDRLKKAVALLPSEPTCPAETYESYESVAIAILDSEYMDFESGLLEEYLMILLHLKRLELGLSPDLLD
jgi:hypothetical protein